VTSWIERLHQKKSPYGRNHSDKSATSEEGDSPEKFIDGRNHSDKSAESITSVTSVTMVSTISEVFTVEYQRFWVDYDLRDGAYTPKELRQAKMLVKPGPVLRYRLRWPGGIPQPMAHG
jgi:hypothetical protein